MINQKEIWKDVVGYEGYYKVSNNGIVVRVAGKVPRHNGKGIVNVPAKKMQPLDNGKGYLRIKLTKNNKPRRVMLHRIIAEAFIPNPNKLSTVNHKNAIKKDNRIENLEWVTFKDNIAHAFSMGLRKCTKEQRLKASIRCSKMKRNPNGSFCKQK